MSCRPIDKRDRIPTIDDADSRGKVRVYVEGNGWVLVDYHTAATFNGVHYWMHNNSGKADANIRMASH
jgi:hypothetical protein